jgi:hypothetical protein
MNYRLRHIRALPCLTAIALSTSLLSVAAVAETIYKSVDAEGNVTFSSTPPAGVEAQQIELQPGPTPAQRQQSLEAEQNLEEQSNELYQETVQESPPEAQEEPVVEPDTAYQQDSGDNENPVYADDGYVDDVDRDERVRDGVDDVKEIEPLPAEIHRPAGRAR